MDNNKESFPQNATFLKYPVPLRSCRPGPRQAELEGSRLEKKDEIHEMLALLRERAARVRGMTLDVREDVWKGVSKGKGLA